MTNLTFKDIVYFRGRAQPIRKHNGKQYYKFPVRIRFNSPQECKTVRAALVEVIARSVVEAANFVRDEFDTKAFTEIKAFGPKGGTADRYIGSETAIINAMLKPTQPEQYDLFKASN